jgi:hypothetical protein
VVADLEAVAVELGDLLPGKVVALVGFEGEAFGDEKRGAEAVAFSAERPRRDGAADESSKVQTSEFFRDGQERRGDGCGEDAMDTSGEGKRERRDDGPEKAGNHGGAGGAGAAKKQGERAKGRGRRPALRGEPIRTGRTTARGRPPCGRWEDRRPSWSSVPARTSRATAGRTEQRSQSSPVAALR